MCMPMPHVKRISCILMQFICLQMFKVYSAWPSQTLRAVRGEPPLQQPCLPSGSNALRIRTVASQGIGPKHAINGIGNRTNMGFANEFAVGSLLDAVHVAMGFTLDPCSSHRKKCRNLKLQGCFEGFHAGLCIKLLIFHRRHWYLLISTDSYCFRLLSGYRRPRLNPV